MAFMENNKISKVERDDQTKKMDVWIGHKKTD